MKKILDELLNKEETPAEVKNRLMESARAYLLLKDIGDLFGSNVPKASVDISNTIIESEKKSNNKKKK